MQRLRQPPPVAAEVEKIREQLAEHRAAGLELDKLLPSFSALCTRGEELITRAAHDDPAAQGEFSLTACSHKLCGFHVCVFLYSLRCVDMNSVGFFLLSFLQRCALGS